MKTPPRDGCSVYVIHDADNTPIYVGLTSRSHVRQAEHMATKTWAEEAHVTRWQHFGSRAEAEAAERELIATLEPRYNLAGNGAAGIRVSPARRAAIERDLAKTGRRRTRARKTLDEISDALPAMVREAHAAGFKKTEIARLAQISRPALDEMLHREH